MSPSGSTSHMETTTHLRIFSSFLKECESKGKGGSEYKESYCLKVNCRFLPFTLNLPYPIHFPLIVVRVACV